MKVLKFGGTSVGTPESLRSVKNIVESCDERVIVVVSALGGITDRLIATAREAEKGSPGYQDMFREIIDRHHAMTEEMVPADERAHVILAIDALFKELSDIYLGVSLLRELSERSLDRVVSYGERLSSTIIEHVINGAVLRFSPSFIRTTRQFGRHVLDNDLTHRCIASEFAEAPERITLVGGFISSDEQGHITNLGRGGSDYTAAILAAELRAETLEIWTDVDGFMTADPRIIPSAKVIDELSFVEAMELCNFGAKVIYPPTIYPVFHRNIPIYIKNTFNPSYPGTRIADIENLSKEPSAGGVSSISDTCLLRVKISDSAVQEATESRMINALSRNGINVFLTSRPAGCLEICCAISASSLPAARPALLAEFSSELETGEMPPLSVSDNLATIALVGENINPDETVRRKICSALHDAKISPVTLPAGSTDSTVSFMVEMDNRVKALQAIHRAFFECGY